MVHHLEPLVQVHKVVGSTPSCTFSGFVISYSTVGQHLSTKFFSFWITMKVTDYFTKWAEAYPLKDSEVPTCMRSLYNNFFSRFGLPRQLHTDQGKNFESKLFYEFCRLTGVRKTRKTPFHPQSDGQTERMNRTLLQMLRATCQENPPRLATKTGHSYVRLSDDCT